MNPLRSPWSSCTMGEVKPQEEHTHTTVNPKGRVIGGWQRQTVNENLISHFLYVFHLFLVLCTAKTLRYLLGNFHNPKTDINNSGEIDKKDFEIAIQVSLGGAESFFFNFADEKITEKWWRSFVYARGWSGLKCARTRRRQQKWNEFRKIFFCSFFSLLFTFLTRMKHHLYKLQTRTKKKQPQKKKKKAVVLRRRREKFKRMLKLLTKNFL